MWPTLSNICGATILGRSIMGHPMKTNVGSYDAGVRFLIGCGVLYAGARGLGWWALLGLLPVLSATFGYCPFYHFFGLDTKKWEDDVERRNGHGGKPSS